MKKKVSLQDIADRLGVSKTLVSLVLNRKGDESGISPVTQKKVLELARKLNYYPNQMARGLRLGSSHTIGLIVADISNIFFAQIARSIEDEAGKYGYSVMFMSSEEDAGREREMIQLLKDRRVDGLILATALHDREDIRRLMKDDVPLVLIDRSVPGVKTNSVLVDNYRGAYEATRHLIGLDYRKIALIKISPSHLEPIRQRTRGYKDALREGGIPVRNKLIREVSFRNVNEEMRDHLQDLILKHSIQALFFLNNNLTVAGLEVINKLHLRIPQDIAVVSFDDIDLFRFAYPPVTAIHQPLDDIGRKAVDLLLKQIRNPRKGKTQITLPVELVIRRSCGAFLKKPELVPKMIE